MTPLLARRHHASGVVGALGARWPEGGGVVSSVSRRWPGTAPRARAVPAGDRPASSGWRDVCHRSQALCRDQATDA